MRDRVGCVQVFEVGKREESQGFGSYNEIVDFDLSVVRSYQRVLVREGKI